MCFQNKGCCLKGQLLLMWHFIRASPLSWFHLGTLPLHIGTVPNVASLIIISLNSEHQSTLFYLFSGKVSGSLNRRPREEQLLSIHRALTYPCREEILIMAVAPSLWVLGPRNIPATRADGWPVSTPTRISPLGLQGQSCEIWKPMSITQHTKDKVDFFSVFTLGWILRFCSPKV